ncbi:hypothetical protein MP228_012710 [Amoeboaphelidium protococcarum]|nr:hypothetical protein MP228_012710 [Amoeboaphelidium protococcarum]
MSSVESTRKLRACLLCSLVKNQNQFRRDGCDNCEQVLQMRDNMDRVYDCTSPNFSGVVSLMEPDDSWVARWQRLDKFTRGVYAVQVFGRLPGDIVEDLQERGIAYRPRDGTAEAL